MHFHWQDALALATVAAAAIYLLRVARAALLRKSGSACGGCPKCPTATAVGSPANLVEVDALVRSAPKR
jgi:hypothetical protein